MSANVEWRTDLTLSDGTSVSLDVLGEKDLEALLRIERRSHAGAWRAEHFLSSLRAGHHHCLGARSGSDWQGYAIVSCAAGEAELLLLVTDVAWQGRGLATAMLQHLFRILEPMADTLFLEVRASNSRAIRLYEQMEFNQVGVRPNYYQARGKCEDALVFARTLLTG